MAEIDHPAIQVQDACVTYGHGAAAVQALKGVSLELARGDVVAIQGPSGSGKSTLLRVMAGLWRPTEGAVLVNGVSLWALSDGERAEIRRREIGFVHQLYNLLPDLTVDGNVTLPLVLDGVPRRVASERTQQILAELDIQSLSERHPEELSGGQMLRVTLARALVIEPSVILADEPTGSLDRANGRRVLELFNEARIRHGVSIAVVTHDPDVAAFADHPFHIVDGQLVT